MKKYGILLGGTLLLAVAFWTVGRSRETVLQVPTAVVQTGPVSQTVSCTGKVEKAGEKVQAVSSGSRVQVRVAVPESRLKQVQVGQTATVSGQAFWADGYVGTVVWLGNTAYTANAGTVVDAVIALEASDSSMKTGLTAQAAICVDTVDGVTVPYTAVEADEQGREFVYVLENGQAVPRYITVRAELADGVLVSEGLTAGERLITDTTAVPYAGAAVEAANV